MHREGQGAITLDFGGGCRYGVLHHRLRPHRLARSIRHLKLRALASIDGRHSAQILRLVTLD
jgi:hypothetical protein